MLLNVAFGMAGANLYTVFSMTGWGLMLITPGGFRVLGLACQGF